jgi:hypothetical protein
MSETKVEVEAEALRGKSYQNFINAIKSPATRKGYINSLKRYLSYLKLKQVDDFLIQTPVISSPKLLTILWL